MRCRRATWPIRSNRGATDFTHALGDIVGHRKKLAGVLIEQEVVVAKMRPTDVPMKVLRLYIESKYIGQQRIEGAGDVFDGFRAKVTGRRQCSPASRSKFVLSSWHLKTPLTSSRLRSYYEIRKLQLVSSRLTLCRLVSSALL